MAIGRQTSFVIGRAVEAQSSGSRAGASLVVGNARPGIVDARLHLLAEPRIIGSGLMGALHALGCILARPAAGIAIAVVGGVEQVDANDVQGSLRR